MAKKSGPAEALIYGAAEQFVSSALQSDDSLFTPGEPIWSLKNIADLQRAFVESPDTSGDTFDVKFQRQLDGSPAEIYQLAAETLFVYQLVAFRGQLKGVTKRAKVENTLSWGAPNVSIPSNLAAVLDNGLLNAGTSFLLHKNFLLSFLIEFAARIKALPNGERSVLLEDPWAFKEFVFSWDATKAQTQRHILLHLVHPDSFESISSRKHKKLIRERFRELSPDTADDDRALFEIRQQLQAQHGETFTFYDQKLEPEWKPSAKNVSPQASSAPLDPTSAPEAGTRAWIEKRNIKGEPQVSEHGLGQALWSPEKSVDGRDYYRNIRAVQPGDVVLHFVDNTCISSVSIVASPPDAFEPPPGTTWSDRPAIRVALRDHVELEPPIDRSDLFDDDVIRQQLRSILNDHKGLFYNKKLQLNQGGYLTEAPTRLVQILSDVYRNKSGLALPHLFVPPRPSQTAVLNLDALSGSTLWPRERLKDIVDSLEGEMPQIVLAGPPGTGKTWIAKHLAKFLTQGRLDGVRLVQFHPSYSYEEFIEGLRPVAKKGSIEFSVEDGVVKRIAQEVQRDNLRRVLIIDEMNRANLSRVLGELMYLLEYRDEPLDLQYSQGFILPKSLCFIGTMNTADRSIRTIDVALRRRFDIFQCWPDVRILEKYFEADEHHNEVSNLEDGFSALNEELTKQLDRHHTIGHTFFMQTDLTRARLHGIWERKVGPLIEEYFFDQPDLASHFTLNRFWPET